MATLPKVFTPVQYGSCPVVGAEEVESPPKERASPVRITGQVEVRLVSVEISTVALEENSPAVDFTKPVPKDEKVGRPLALIEKMAVVEVAKVVGLEVAR